MAQQKVKETTSTKLFIGCGNCGIGALIFGVIAILFGTGTIKVIRQQMTYFYIALGIAIAAFIGAAVLGVFAVIELKKEKAETVKKPKNAGHNEKRQVYVVAGAIIKDGYVFSAQRGNKGETKFKWEFPGGKIEPGETPKQALARELFEELKIKVKVHERITNIVDEYPTQVLHIDTYRCELLEGTPTLTEHINMAWSNKEELDKLEFSPADKPTLEKIKKLYL